MIGTSYFSNPNRENAIRWMFKKWRENTSNVPAGKVLTVTLAGCLTGSDPLINEQFVHIDGDIGSVGDILHGRKSHFMEACPASIMLCAWAAYLDECDFIFKEQDCLAFGPWVDRLYSDCGELCGVFGRCRLMGSACSLFLIRHSSIPQFCADYISTGPLNIQSLMEHKFMSLANRFPKRWGYHSMGVDRDRPLPFNDEAWYAQQFTHAEMLELGRRNLVDLEGMPVAKCFTNNL